MPICKESAWPVSSNNFDNQRLSQVSNCLSIHGFKAVGWEPGHLKAYKMTTRCQFSTLELLLTGSNGLAEFHGKTFYVSFCILENSSENLFLFSCFSKTFKITNFRLPLPFRVSDFQIRLCCYATVACNTKLCNFNAATFADALQNTIKYLSW